MYKRIAEETYKLFSDKDGNEHIASEGALRYILKYLRRREAKTMLEVGTGIGTVLWAVRRGVQTGFLDRDLVYCGTEADVFCKSELEKNVGSPENTSMFESLAEVPEHFRFDFALVDGQDPVLSTIPGRMSKGGIIFVEGGRPSQVSQLKVSLRKSVKKIFLTFREVDSIKRPYGPFSKRLFGGGAVIILDPTKRDYFYALTRKIATKFKFQTVFYWLKIKMFFLKK